MACVTFVLVTSWMSTKLSHNEISWICKATQSTFNITRKKVEFCVCIIGERSEPPSDKLGHARASMSVTYYIRSDNQYCA